MPQHNNWLSDVSLVSCAEHMFRMMILHAELYSSEPQTHASKVGSVAIQWSSANKLDLLTTFVQLVSFPLILVLQIMMCQLIVEIIRYMLKILLNVHCLYSFEKIVL